MVLIPLLVHRHRCSKSVNIPRECLVNTFVVITGDIHHLSRIIHIRTVHRFVAVSERYVYCLHLVTYSFLTRYYGRSITFRICHKV